MPHTSQPLVSVVLAVYNGQRFLQEALDSILAQTMQDFELIVIDDASTDSTPEILDRCPSEKIVRLANPANLGQTRSLNKGLAVAKGRYIARHDADDISHPERFAKQVEFLQANPQVGLLSSNYTLIDRFGSILECEGLPTSDAPLRERLYESNLLCHGSTMINHDCLREVGGYNEYFRVTQDYDLWLRLSEQCELANLPDFLYQFRFDSSTVTHTRRALQLAYVQLARKLAAQRRAGQPEDPYPDNVLAAYPVQPALLFNYMRRSAYLFCAAKQTDQATRSLKAAWELQQQHHIDSETGWDEWALVHGRLLSQLHQDTAAGADFIRWVFENTECTHAPRSTKKTIARYYVDQAFLAHQRGRKDQVFENAVNAIRNDRRWLTNKGLWVIAGKSLVP